MSGVTAVSPPSFAGYAAQLGNGGGAQAQPQPVSDPDHDGDRDRPGRLDVKV
jgi:hypothetical protein